MALVHGDGEVAKCEEASGALFNEEIAGLSEEMLLAVTQDAPGTPIPREELVDGLTLADLLLRTGLATSKKEARRTIEQGGAYVNGARQSDGSRTLGPADLLYGRYVVLRKGEDGCTSSGPHEEEVSRHLCPRPDRVRRHPLVLRRGGPGRLEHTPDGGLGERDQFRGERRHAGG